MTNIEKTIDIINQAKKMKIQKVSLGFSTGKDSLIGLDLLLKNGIEVCPVYFYIVPGMTFIEENLAIYEKYYNLKIVRLPHPMLQDFINLCLYQPLHKAKFMTMFYNKDDSYCKFSGIMNWYFKEENIDIQYDCNCMKMADSLNRRLLLRNKPDIDTERKVIYLGKYLKTSEIWHYLKEQKIPITNDYDIFGRSADNLLNYQYLIGVKKYYPDDYKKIIEYFPLADVEIKRYNAYLKLYENGKE